MSDSTVGNIPLKYVPLGLSIIVMATCVLNYIICRQNDTCYPFPYSTITNCSTMYPNNVIFRFFLLLPSLGFFLYFNAIYGWLKYQGEKLLLGKIEAPVVIKTLGYLGVPFFWIAIATIDQGRMDNVLHTTGAVVFFVLWAFVCWIIFFTLLRIYLKNPLVTSIYSVGLKLVICVWQWIKIVELLLRVFQPTNPYYVKYYGNDGELPADGEDSPIVVEIEWGTMFSCCLFILTTWYEFQKIYMSLDMNFEFVFSEIKAKQEELNEKSKKYELLRNKKRQQSMETEVSEGLQQQQYVQQQQQQQQQQVYYGQQYVQQTPLQDGLLRQQFVQGQHIQLQQY